ncbi:hypothetical protein [Streptomyces angustmyceticus]|uniref:hypothetical protein n=1 Tax=Streptomyces angustmyceticus TaxID=285578 RepID=UPI003450B99F
MSSHFAAPEPHGHHALTITLFAAAILTKGDMEKLLLALNAAPLIAPHIARLTGRR